MIGQKGSGTQKSIGGRRDERKLEGYSMGYRHDWKCFSPTVDALASNYLVMTIIAPKSSGIRNALDASQNSEIRRWGVRTQPNRACHFFSQETMFRIHCLSLAVLLLVSWCSVAVLAKADGEETHKQKHVRRKNYRVLDIQEHSNSKRVTASMEVADEAPDEEWDRVLQDMSMVDCIPFPGDSRSSKKSSKKSKRSHPGKGFCDEDKGGSRGKGGLSKLNKSSKSGGKGGRFGKGKGGSGSGKGGKGGSSDRFARGKGGSSKLSKRSNSEGKGGRFGKGKESDSGKGGKGGSSDRSIRGSGKGSKDSKKFHFPDSSRSRSGGMVKLSRTGKGKGGDSSGKGGKGSKKSKRIRA